MIHSASDTLRFGVVEELLKGLEGEEAIDKTLISAEELFIEDVSDRFIIQAKQRLATLNQRYSKGEMKDDEVRFEISNILLMLT